MTLEQARSLNNMSTLETTKKSFAAYKGHYNRSLKLFNALLDVKPLPTLSSIESSYNRLQQRMDSLFNSTEPMISLFEETEFTADDNVDVTAELETYNRYYDSLISEKTKMETRYAKHKEDMKSVTGEREQVSLNTTIRSNDKPTVKLTALSPPSWNGVKADFYTWKQKFMHIMYEAKVSDELTQLCYIQNSPVLPTDYLCYISDCSSINEVLKRLEERILRETMKYEVITQLKRVKPLPMRRSASVLRDFASEISLFSRRMTDLGFNKENYMCIIMQDIYERLDQDTARGYRNKIGLKKELGMNVQEDLDSLCDFIRSEVTTLELLAGSSPFAEKPIISKKLYAIDTKTDEISGNSANKMKCILGCESVHRLIDCENYMELTLPQ